MISRSVDMYWLSLPSYYLQHHCVNYLVVIRHAGPDYDENIRPLVHIQQNKVNFHVDNKVILNGQYMSPISNGASDKLYRVKRITRITINIFHTFAADKWITNSTLKEMKTKLNYQKFMFIHYKQYQAV